MGTGSNLAKPGPVHEVVTLDIGWDAATENGSRNRLLRLEDLRLPVEVWEPCAVPVTYLEEVATFYGEPDARGRVKAGPTWWRPHEPGSRRE